MNVFKKVTFVDPFLTIPIFVLILIGLVMVFSASSLMASENYSDSLFFLKRQVVFLILGLCVGLVFFFLQLRWLKNFSSPILLAVCGALLLVIFFGTRSHHATRWLNLGFFKFQPSEFMKPALLMFVAKYLSKKGNDIKNFQMGLLPLLIVLSVVFALILAQPDFGTVVVLALSVFVMLFVSGARWAHLSGILAVFGVASYFLLFNVAYRRRRLFAFMDPWADPQGSGFQIIQSLLSFQRGGVSGQGLGDGTQKLLYLPEAHTDFIFSVIAEELGLMGSLIIIVLFLIFVVQGFRLSLRLQEAFVSQLALGLTTLIGFQAFLNMAVVTAMVPTKGLTLPFISYGGSSLLSTFICVGILFSLSAWNNWSEIQAKRSLQ